MPARQLGSHSPCVPAGGHVQPVDAATRAALSRSSARGTVLGTVTSREPLAVLGSRHGWLRVQTDAGRTGWIRVGATC
jgi:Bacterial SH3 domain